MLQLFALDALRSIGGFDTTLRYGEDVDLVWRLTEAGAQAPVAASDWRQSGLGAQILADLGVRRLRVIGTPRRFLGLSGFGLEVVDYAPSES